MTAALELRAGPFRGVYDSPDVVSGRSVRLRDAANCYIPDLENGSAVVARHGFLNVVSTLGGTGQCVFLHRRLDGTLDRLFAAGGKLYRWDGATTTTDVTPAGIAIDAANPVFMVSFNDRVVVSDGQNKAWLFNPADLTGAVIELNAALDAYALQGPPVVYAGKVFAILKATGGETFITEDALDDLLTESGETLLTEFTSGYRNTLIWSLENDATVGYDQTNYDYTWQLTQGSSEILSALFADEGILLYWRVRGIGYISGSTVDDFKAQATRDAVHPISGTDAPAAVVAAGAGRTVFYVDLDGRVHMLPVGGEPRQLWHPMRHAVADRSGLDASRTDVATYARAGYHEAYNLVLFTIWDRTTLYAFDADTGIYVGTWNLGSTTIGIDAMGTMVDASGRACFVMLGNGFTGAGGVWRQKFADDHWPWLDEWDGGALQMTLAVETHDLVSESARTFRVRDVSAEFIGTDGEPHAVDLVYTTPAGGASAAIASTASAVAGDVSVARWALGRNAQGSAIRFRFVNEYQDNVQWGLVDVTATVLVTQARSRAR